MTHPFAFAPSSPLDGWSATPRNRSAARDNGSSPQKRRVRQLTSELNGLEGHTEEDEERSRAIIRRIVALAAPITTGSGADDEDDGDVGLVMTRATAAVRSALTRVHGVPESELNCLVPSGGSGVLCLAQWEALLPSQNALGAGNTATTTTTGDVLFVKKHRAAKICFARPPTADSDGRTSSSAAPRTAKQADVPAATAADVRESVVDAVRRGILELKDGARLLQTQLGGEQPLLDQNQVLMQKSLTNTASQTRQVDTISSSGKRSGGLSSRVPLVGYLLERVPGVAFVWDHVLTPLWYVVRRALLIAVVLSATGVTVWMMLLVPRAYVRAH